jgi:hypothetical protein
MWNPPPAPWPSGSSLHAGGWLWLSRPRWGRHGRAGTDRGAAAVRIVSVASQDDDAPARGRQCTANGLEKREQARQPAQGETALRADVAATVRAGWVPEDRGPARRTALLCCSSMDLWLTFNGPATYPQENTLALLGEPSAHPRRRSVESAQ